MYCTVLLKDNSYWLPERESPTSHILKFEITDYRHLPADETLTTYLAATVELHVVDINLRYTGKNPFALVTRYDQTG